MKTKYCIFILIFIFAAFSFSGCGYTTGSLLPGTLKTIYVEGFKNRIDISSEPSDKEGIRLYRAGLETNITKAIIDEFIFDGHLRIVERDDADLVLTGELTDYYKQPLRYDKYDNIEEYRVIITVNMELKDTVKNEVMWEEKGFVGYDTNRLTGPFASTEENAREDAIEDLAKKTVEKVIEGW